MFTLRDSEPPTTQTQDRELLAHLYQVLLEIENDPAIDPEIRPELLGKARADYAAAEAWYASKHNVDMEVGS